MTSARHGRHDWLGLTPEVERFGPLLVDRIAGALGEPSGSLGEERIGELIRYGTVVSVDHAAATCAVRAGEVVTGPIRWAESRAGDVKVWSPPSEGEQVMLRRVGRKLVLPAVHADLHRLLRLVGDIDLGSRILADQHHGQARRDAMLGFQLGDFLGDLRPARRVLGPATRLLRRGPKEVLHQLPRFGGECHAEVLRGMELLPVALPDKLVQAGPELGDRGGGIGEVGHGGQAGRRGGTTQSAVTATNSHLARRLHCAPCRLVPMTVQYKHLRGSAGTSFTKAVVCSCRAQMRPVAQHWNIQTGAGFQA